jgi:hypothetical protein
MCQAPCISCNTDRIQLLLVFHISVHTSLALLLACVVELVEAVVVVAEECRAQRNGMCQAPCSFCSTDRIPVLLFFHISARTLLPHLSVAVVLMVDQEEDTGTCPAPCNACSTDQIQASLFFHISGHTSAPHPLD